jgi:Peptidase family M1 domain
VTQPTLTRWGGLTIRAAMVLCAVAAAGLAGTATQEARPQAYDRIKAFELGGGSADVQGLILKRDRLEMSFTGTFHFATPIDGRVTGAVFIGTGSLKAEVPPVEFERENVRRLLGADAIESDFRTAVLRMTDDTFNQIGNAPPPREAGDAPAPAQKLASEFEPQLLKETGLNLSARLAAAIANREEPGVFFAQFDGGRRGRFSAIIDHQTRIPVSKFGINGGEKGLIFAYQSAIYAPEVWLAFYLQSEYAARTGTYSDANDLVDITNYALDVDVRDAAKRLGVTARIDLTAKVDQVRAVPFNLGEGLGLYDQAGLKNQFRVTSVTAAGQRIAFAQEPWESGFTAFLPAPLAAGARATLEVTYEGEFMMSHPLIPQCYYLISNSIWLPRHGYLDRATYDMTYRTLKRHKVASSGVRQSEQPDSANADVTITKYRLDQPVSLVAFGIGPFERVGEPLRFEAGGQIPLEFSGTVQSIQAIKADFILAEMGNSVRYFADLFGKYPYPNFGAVFHPRGYGQGFATMLFIPNADSATLPVFAFIAHETAHQWWGNIVAWRSYRDQWLSEGFAEYSGMLYASKRATTKDALRTLLREAREDLVRPPATLTGIGKGRLVDIGPVVLGHRLNSSKSFGAYQALIYQKGAYILRMLNFLLADPARPDDEAPFKRMMSEFVARHRDGTASTDDFFRVAGTHFANSPIARKYGLSDLNWFYRQWVTRTEYPSYALEYELKPQPDGKVIVAGTVAQAGVPADWAMPVPIVFTFSGNQVARTTVLARGASSTFELSLPMKPSKVELDPDAWVLAEKVTTKAK